MKTDTGPGAAMMALPALLLVSLLAGGCVGSITPPSSAQPSGQNSAPIANAGPNQTVAVSTLVTLNGSASLDPEKSPLTYSWTLTSLPPGSKAALSHANEVAATFVPDVAGIYIASLVVSDGQLSSGAATVAITATGPSTVNYSSNLSLALTVNNATPAIGQTVVLGFTVANAGPDPAESVTVVGGLPMGLDYVLASPAVGSYDPVGNEWKIGTLAAGASANLNLALTLTSPAAQNYGAVVTTSTKDPGPANDRASVTIASTQPVSTCQPWSPTAAFSAGQCTIYEGNIYTAKWWTQGETPGSTPSTAWSLYGPVGGSTAAAPLCPAWVAALAFTIGHCTIYQNKTYLAKWWTQGDTPGASQSGPWQLYTPATTPSGSQCTTWTASAIFTTGQCATYQGNVYKSNWWTQGDIPSNTPGGPWSLIGPAPA